MSLPSTNNTITMVVEYSAQRRKFILSIPIDFQVLSIQMSEAFSLDKTGQTHVLQTFDEQVQDYIDIDGQTFQPDNLRNKTVIRAKLVSVPFTNQDSNSEITTSTAMIHTHGNMLLPHHQTKFSTNSTDTTTITKSSVMVSPQTSTNNLIKIDKSQIVGLMTLEGLEKSLELWIQQAKDYQYQMSQNLVQVKSTIAAVKQHYQITDDQHIQSQDLYPSPVSSPPKQQHSQTSRSITTSAQYQNGTDHHRQQQPTILGFSHSSNGTNSHRHSSSSSLSSGDIIGPEPIVYENKKQPLVPVAYNIRSAQQKSTINENEYCVSYQSTVPLNKFNNNHNHSKPNTTIDSGNGYQRQQPSQSQTYKQNSIDITSAVVPYQRFERGIEFEGHVIKLYNPSYFFLRITNQTATYDEMDKDLNLHYNSVDCHNTYNPKRGDFCAALSDMDGKWYRARIIRLKRTENFDLYEVIYIDSGEMSSLQLSQIRPLGSKFAQLPVQALACTLGNVIPASSQQQQLGWNRRSCMAFENCTNKSKKLKISVLDSTDIKWPMMFIHIATPNHPNVAEYMSSLFLTKSSTNIDISNYWCKKIRPEQYILFNMSSLINQKLHFHTSIQINRTNDEIIDLIIKDLEWLQRE
ncbi:unnamed protein product [Didymodactylos carnosus]|uniref:Tudor domain-containing protein n=1 Tax=Didymodactylos carnosus TaxID=1234261 RepID=A0A814F7K8_9BILA|nr:unnamed protein product [Didymodactylos carnosus]CAF0982052.1 unnamed protein product [Didymodactylos carnosus]CAF3683897.1 unnamed protein product [Didymodactylos carnosus]CAF3754573.1 unnamed protein product [Didymodactylos carnosus]